MENRNCLLLVAYMFVKKEISNNNRQKPLCNAILLAKHASHAKHQQKK